MQFRTVKDHARRPVERRPESPAGFEPVPTAPEATSVYQADLHKQTFTALYGARKEVAEVHGVARRSMGLIWAMISKSWSRCRTVIPASSAVAAMIRKGMKGARC